MLFECHPNLSKKDFICDLPLCRVLLEDDRHYPWILLVPRQNNIARMMDLTFTDQVQCLKELDWAQKILWNHFEVIQLNVAAIGNKTPQLHIHVLGRTVDDPAWPGTVWDHPIHAPYTLHDKEVIIQTLKNAFLSALKTLES
jgi:diadenosine tetraphosphate (Ap4A) HIT family hydrolase